MEEKQQHQLEQEETKEDFQKIKTQELNVEYTTYQNLLDIFKEDNTNNTTISQLTEEIKSSDNDWKQQFNLITNLRCLNKYYPDQFSNELPNFIKFIVLNGQNLRSNLSKNALMLVKEIFVNQLDLSEEEYCLLVRLVYEKVSCEKNFLKFEANESIKQLIKIKNLSIIKKMLPMILEFCSDKNATICQNASGALYELLKNSENQFESFDNSLKEIVVKTLVELVKGKRAILKKNGELICLLLEKEYGYENFDNFIQKYLNTDEQNLIKHALAISKKGKNNSNNNNNSKSLQDFLQQQRSKDKQLNQ